ncbi:hypothetical protein AGMMS50276_22050 [Synergistales bacterium]|nr:hypothetical protein AGMMS50276_22050 [Synergistales bacterium]
MKKGIIWLVGLLCMAVILGSSIATAPASAAAAKSEGKTSGFTVGILNPYIGNNWRAQYVADAEEVCKRYKASGELADYQIATCNNDVSQQLTQITNMINTGVDALVIDAASATALTPVIKRARSEGILVVMSNAPAAYEDTIAVICDDPLFSLVNLTWLATELGGKGNIVQITGLVGNSEDNLRIASTEKMLKETYPNIKLLASAPANWVPSEAQAVMSTFISTYNNIDGILQQDITAPGVIRAYENAGIKAPLMTGDYSFGFLRTWESQLSEFKSVAYTMSPGIISDVMGVTINLLKGKTFKEGALQPNPLNPNMVNAIMIEPSYIVTNEPDPNAPWMKGLKYAKSIGVAEAVKLGEGQSDEALLDGHMTQEQIDSLFN